MMKKINKYRLKFGLLIMSLSTVFLGCTDLEEVPDGLLSPESFFQSESDFDSASLGVYRSLFGGWGNFSFNHSFLISGGADDVGTRPSDVSKFQYDSFRTNPAGGSHTFGEVYMKLLVTLIQL